MNRLFCGSRVVVPRTIALMAIDLVCIWAAIVLAFVIRYEALISVWPYLQWGRLYFFIAPLVQIPIFYALGLYNRIWRYASTHDMARILLAGALSSAVLYLVNFLLLPPLDGPWVNSRSIWLLEGVLSTCFVASVRFILRLQQERQRQHVVAPLQRSTTRNGEPIHVLIVGAGDSGSMILAKFRLIRG